MAQDVNQAVPDVPRQRVAVIGNSYVGALDLAYRLYAQDPWNHYFGFFGGAGDAFAEIKIEGRSLVGVQTSSEFASNRIDDYDYFVVFGNLPAPHHLVEVNGWLKDEGYSRAVRDAQRGDVVRQRHAFTLSRQLLAMTAAPVMMLWRTISLDDKRLDEESYGWLVRELRALVHPAHLIEPPRAMLDDGFITHAHFHQDSVGLGGVRPSGHAHHDRAHINAEGGRLLLAEVARTISRHCAAESEAR